MHTVLSAVLLHNKDGGSFSARERTFSTPSGRRKQARTEGLALPPGPGKPFIVLRSGVALHAVVSAPLGQPCAAPPARMKPTQQVQGLWREWHLPAQAATQQVQAVWPLLRAAHADRCCSPHTACTCCVAAYAGRCHSLHSPCACCVGARLCSQIWLPPHSCACGVFACAHFCLTHSQPQADSSVSHSRCPFPHLWL